MPRPKILLVENSKIILQIEKRYLKDAATVFTAGDGEQALRIVGNIRPDLVYVAFNLPGMSGADCCRALKSNLDLPSLQVVMVCSATGGESDLCREARCDAVIFKPLVRRDFMEAGRLCQATVVQNEKPVTCRASVVCSLKDSVFYGTIEDVCSNGMFVGSSWEIATGETLHVKFVLPWSGASLIETAAEVTWVNGGKRRRNSQLPPGFGLAFKCLKEDSAEQINDYIELMRLRFRM